ncbi:MAG: hypothetical protein HY394_05145 [Candidatus Diapherotrites archaeon]|nr:hypothetical protein [Candidatus Diapherotrites archaeon]
MKELRRQFLHFAFGSAILALVLVAGTSVALPATATMLAAGIVLSWVVSKGADYPPAKVFLKLAGRKAEKSMPGKGAIYLFLGATLSMLLFYSNEKAVITGLTVLVFGDSIATVIGKRFGKTRIANNRTLEGTVACIAVSFLALLSFLNPLQAAVAGIAGAISEFLPIDDNITMPVFAAATIAFLL